MAVQGPLARGRGHAPTGLIVAGQRRERVLGIVRDEDLAPGFEERVQALPCIRQDGYAARGRLEQPSGRQCPMAAIAARVTFSVSPDELKNAG